MRSLSHVSRCRFVLDGFPVTMHQVELLTQRSIVPVRVVELRVDSIEVVTRATYDRFSEQRCAAVALRCEACWWKMLLRCLNCIKKLLLSFRTLPLHDSAQITAERLTNWQKEVSCGSGFYRSPKGAE